MLTDNDLQKIAFHKNLHLLCNQAVEGFFSGLHRSPFRGFSSEFLEHKNYNSGESTRHIDWKLYAKTNKFFTKQFQDETNLRAHVVFDNSSSMYFPKANTLSLENPNKISFSVFAAAAMMNLLKRQRDAVGLSIYSENYEFYAPEKTNERHHQKLLNALIEYTFKQPKPKKTYTYTFLHHIVEKIHRRSLVLLFTDMFQTEVGHVQMFEALRHFKYKKHNVVLFHILDKRREVAFDYTDSPRKFIDVETGEKVNLYGEFLQKDYKNEIEKYFSLLRLKCMQYNIHYVEADISRGIKPVLESFLIEYQKII